jgi:prophage regulatory protein
MQTQPQEHSPRHRLISVDEVEDRIGWSRTTLWRRCRDGEFPKPVLIGPRRIAWPESDVDQWIARQITKRTAA